MLGQREGFVKAEGRGTDWHLLGNTFCGLQCMVSRVPGVLSQEIGSGQSFYTVLRNLRFSCRDCRDVRVF